MQTTEQTPLPNKNAIAVKLAIIAALMLLLLLPSAWIQDLITEREGYLNTKQTNTANRWAPGQLIRGPILVIPYMQIDGKSVPTTQQLYILPEELNISAQVHTRHFSEGVQDITVYDSKINISGAFLYNELAKSGIKPENFQLDKASLVFGVTGLKGLKSNPVVSLAGQQAEVQPAFNTINGLGSGLQASFRLPATERLPFSFTLNLNGSETLQFLNLGKKTSASVTGDWRNPIPIGSQLPDQRDSLAKGFVTGWHMLYYNRPFPQQWTGNDNVLENDESIKHATFGLKFHKPVDQYRKTMRTAKYSSLIILLTFVSLFLTELIRRQNIHVFNYVLIGAAMVVYYTLLLSFAEHVGYDWAYLISSAATISLIAWFTSSLMHNRAVALLFGSILCFFYSFIYIIIQLEELSLLIGSIALFLIVAALMYFSRKINWDRH